MTKTTAEIERTVTEEQEFMICDDCSREVDSDGERRAPHDFCSVCAPKYNGGEPETVITAREWKTETHNISMKDAWEAAYHCGWLALLASVLGPLLLLLGIGGVFGVALGVLLWAAAVIALSLGIIWLRDFKQRYVQVAD